MGMVSMKVGFFFLGGDTEREGERESERFGGNVMSGVRLKRKGWYHGVLSI